MKPFAHLDTKSPTGVSTFMDPLIGDWKVNSFRHITTEDGELQGFRSEAKTKNYYLSPSIIFEEWEDTNPDGTPYLAINLRAYKRESDIWEVVWIPSSDNNPNPPRAVPGRVNENGFLADIPTALPPDKNRIKFDYRFIERNHNYWAGSRTSDGKNWTDFWTMDFIRQDKVLTQHWKNLFRTNLDPIGQMLGKWSLEVEEGRSKSNIGHSSIALGLGGLAIIETIETSLPGHHRLRIFRYSDKMEKWLLFAVSDEEDGIWIYEEVEPGTLKFVTPRATEEVELNIDENGITVSLGSTDINYTR